MLHQVNRVQTSTPELPSSLPSFLPSTTCNIQHTSFQPCYHGWINSFTPTAHLYRTLLASNWLTSQTHRLTHLFKHGMPPRYRSFVLSIVQSQFISANIGAWMLIQTGLFRAMLAAMHSWYSITTSIVVSPRPTLTLQRRIILGRSIQKRRDTQPINLPHFLRSLVSYPEAQV